MRTIFGHPALHQQNRSVSVVLWGASNFARSSGTLSHCERALCVWDAGELCACGSEITCTWEFPLGRRATHFVLLLLSPFSSPPPCPMDSAHYWHAGLTSQPGNTHRPWSHPQQLPPGLRSEPPCPPPSTTDSC